LKGTESDILQDGSLDYPDHLLEQFDVIIANLALLIYPPDNHFICGIFFLPASESLTSD